MKQSGQIPSVQPDRSALTSAAAQDEAAAASSEKVVVLASVAVGQPSARALTGTASAKWTGVLERVRGAAHYIREVEDRAQEYELRVHELLEQVRADLRDADAKVRAAEQRAREVEAQASNLIQFCGGARAAAEERAATAEEWLQRISEAIETEFVAAPAAPQKTGALSA
ncbi:hypothetical protein ACU4GR_13070 [Methylobacterium oryzae CBMB20]